MFTKRTTAFVALSAALLAAACDDTPTNVDEQNDAAVEGRVEETTPAPSSGPSPQRAPGSQAQTVSVVHIDASGEYSELASADVRADGTYRIEGVPSGRTNTAVVAYVDGRAAGEVLIHGEIRSRATIRPAPITYETTMETRAYARVVASGRADQTSTSEIALLLHADGSDLESTLSSDAQVQAIADGSAEAGATMGGVFADAGVALDADARADLLVNAALDLAADLIAGLTLDVAHDEYAEAAIDAYMSAGASLDAIVTATAAAASTFDAELEGRTDIRGRLIAEPILLNLRARERITVQHSASAEGTVAAVIESSLGSGRASVEAATTAAEVRAALQAHLESTIDAATDAAVELLAADASITVRANVRAAAEAALDEATLWTRLEGSASASASAAASAAADYRAAVRSKVQAMVEAAEGATADVDVMTSLFIAACGGAYIR